MSDRISPRRAAVARRAAIVRSLPRPTRTRVVTAHDEALALDLLVALDSLPTVTR